MSRRRVKRARRRARVEMLPLIDVLFLLLAVFLLSIARMVRSYSIPVELPQARTGVEEQLDAVLLLSVDADGQPYVAGEAFALDEVRQQVAERVQADPSLQILLQADRGAEHGAVAEVLDAIREVGGGKVLLVSRRAEDL
jgi:biopolymer transport protein ExbD